MASYNLNDVLKRKSIDTPSEDKEIRLDDVSRVKVLSPTRQVIKRFLRNRLAVFGFVSIIVLFIFCFIGPIFYPYGQKQTFYKYDEINTKLGVATESTSFTGYTVDSSIVVDTKANNLMTTNIKTLQQKGLSSYVFLAPDEKAYEVDALGEYVYTLSQREATRIASFGKSDIEIASYDGVSRSFTYLNNASENSDFEAFVTKKLKGNKGNFSYNGDDYSFKKTVGKSYSITKSVEGFVYLDSPISEEFEHLAEKSASNTLFDFENSQYFIINDGSSNIVYRVGEKRVAKVFTTFVIDFFDSTNEVSDEFRNNALLNVYSSDSFTSEGKKYSFYKDEDGDVITIFDENNNEVGEFSTFIIRRNNGEDSIPYEAKKDIAEGITEMLDKNEGETAFETNLPKQTEDGRFETDENGKTVYIPTEIRVVKTDRSYELWANQITYVIDRFASPSLTHILGTDGDGFDVFSRIMHGGRVSLMVGFVVVLIELILGIVLGGLAGYYGGWVDNLIMRLVDIFYCLPSMPIMIILGGIMDAMRMDVYRRLFIMMAVLGIMGWAGVARLVRGQILSFREQEFMIAAEATGIKIKDRIFKHLIPNVMPQLIVLATMGVGGTILTESTLSFLGLGVKHPLATWGTMINSVSSASAMAHYAYIWIPVGLLISFTVISFNFVGDGLRDAYDPKGKR